MKKLEELGISPAPWSVGYGSYNLSVFTPPRKCDGCKMMICGAFGNEASANLMAAAPDLYKELYDACVAKCLRCGVGNMETETHFCGNACPTVRRWRSLLAKAAGEEVEDGK